MHKLLVLYPEPADRTAFEQYYRTHHLPLAARLPRVRWSRFSVALDGAPYAAVFEAEFDSREDYVAAMASPEGQAVQADVPNYAPPGTLVLDFPVEQLTGG
ncbi:EthD family reductase [Tersicoccus sp. Bi-70]|uniref:EthD family reductase n=1 Tax=Tersicoccus sp. Bi-70 TaxID=1897634 RepID=UPI0009757B57|nr:EthD family reductase [Tersicoccus sp. Bi-70]OMH34994.1 ethyl tert-butyl ether degradation protein EthD [Tersicoccus sp. Bi-70]